MSCIGANLRWERRGSCMRAVFLIPMKRGSRILDMGSQSQDEPLTWHTEALWPVSWANGFPVRVYGFQRGMERSRPHDASTLKLGDQSKLYSPFLCPLDPAPEPPGGKPKERASRARRSSSATCATKKGTWIATGCRTRIEEQPKLLSPSACHPVSKRPRHSGPRRSTPVKNDAANTHRKGNFCFWP